MAESLVELLRGYAASQPDAPCLAFGEETLRFADLNRRSNALGNALTARGVQPGDRVAILAPTSIVFFELAFACAKIGAIMLPLNWRLSAREIGDILADGLPSVILISQEMDGLLSDIPVPVDQIVLETEYPDWRDAAPPHDPGYGFRPDDITMLLYTSGTTGKPKGVMITHANLAHVARMAREIWDFSGSSVNLVAMPLFHIGGIGYGMMALSQGGHTVLLQQPDPQAVMDTIAAHGVTHAFFVPTVVQRLVDFAEAHGQKPTGLQKILYGAAPIGEGLLRRAIALFDCGFSHAYGMTETAGTVISLPAEEHDPDGPNPERLRSCGKPLPWVELDLVDPATGRSVEKGEVGEIRIRSGMVMAGYWKKPEETAATITADGWLCTGDAAYRDADGFVYIHDRYKDMIVSGAENIYPTEVENVIADHPAVAQVAVIGVPDPKWGETPRAYVVPRADMPLTEAELAAFTRERLARYKCPSSFVFIDALPLNASGKLLKTALRELDRRRFPAPTDVTA